MPEAGVEGTLQRGWVVRVGLADTAWVVWVGLADTGVAHGSLSHTEAGFCLLGSQLVSSISPSLKAPKGNYMGRKRQEGADKMAQWVRRLPPSPIT